MANPETLQVEVVYALPDTQSVVTLALQRGANAQDAIMESGLLQRFPALELAKLEIGIFGWLVTADTLLKDGDRVEIYRPLTRDPKLARRELAKAGKTMGSARKGSSGN
jgi:putative ubiquitin-RnfH superfamily antitoxin RatB of RatAB toxin-antitoxin module